MNDLILILGSISGIAVSILGIYFYIRNSGSKLDYLKASISLQNGNFREAEKYYMITLKKTSPNNLTHLSALMGLQNLYFQENKIEISLLYLDKAIEISKKNKNWKTMYQQLINIKEKHFQSNSSTFKTE
ncbi:hypothetical protein [Flavobacterium sp.]|uniref:hypothetical protein n=1 Tax=Flavobacterium sp. TaxID=239 RepID=UPI002625FD83|nr:hypothetical protein [Flavobacterium sp.]